MSSVFSEYLHRMRLSEEKEPESPGMLPFITISRETGCHSLAVAGLLQQTLNANAKVKWQLVSKEIIAEAARNLQLNTAQVKGILAGEKRSHLSEILHSVADHAYLSDHLVRKKLIEFIESAASRGNVIIIGRAGAIITARIPNGLHIRLVAPLEWRIKNIMNQQNTDYKTARQWVELTDQKRKRLIEDFSHKPLNDMMFDMVLNNATLSEEEIAQIVAQLILKRYQK